MADERRRAPRARITGARVRYEGATGERHSGRALDLSSGGVFVETAHPTTVGKRISLEIQVAGELAPWPALGRVIWVRQGSGGGQPPAGMGVAFIDLEDAVRLAIDRVLRGVLARSAANGQGIPSTAPAREATVLGVGPSGAEVRPSSPVVAAPPARENTVLGVGAPAQSPAVSRAAPQDGNVTAAMPAVGAIPAAALREDSFDEAGWDRVEPGAGAEPPPAAPVPATPAAKATEAPSLPEPVPAPPALDSSVALDLVAKKPPSVAPPKVEEPAPTREREHEPRTKEESVSLAPAGVPRRGGGGRFALVALLALVAGGSYVERERLRPFVGPYVQKAMSVAGASTPSPPAPPAAETGPPAAASSSPAQLAAALPASAAPQALPPRPAGSSAPAPSTAKPATPAAGGASNAPAAAAGNAPAPAAKANVRRAAPAAPKAPAQAAQPAGETPPENPDNPY